MANQIYHRRSNVVARDIARAWRGLARFRLQKDHWANIRLDGGEDHASGRRDQPGRMLLCEALECFLVPAQSPLLQAELEDLLGMRPAGGDLFDGEDFLGALATDIRTLVDSVFLLDRGRVIGTRFYTDPYCQLESLCREGLDEPQNVDCAASVAAVLLHTWHLFGPSSWLGAQHLTSFRAVMDIVQVPMLVDACIDYILKCHVTRQGWRWTDHAAVQPGLYFTWAVCEAFNEIDDIVLVKERLAADGDPSDPSTWDQKAIAESPFQFSRHALWEQIRSVRRWALDLLPIISSGAQFRELHLTDPRGETDFRYTCFPVEEYARRKNDVEKAEALVPWLNNLMLLDILVLTYADKAADAVGAEEKMERALMWLVKKLRSPEVLEVMTSYEYLFYLDPGQGEVLDVNKLRTRRARSVYGDKSFIPLLLRVLVLFIQYGIGNPIVLHAQIASLYEALLDSRNESVEDQYVWDRDGLSIFTTQRALEALRDYLLLLAAEEPDNIGGQPPRRQELADAMDGFVDRLKTALTASGDSPAITTNLFEGLENQMAALRGELRRIAGLEAEVKELRRSVTRLQALDEVGMQVLALRKGLLELEAQVTSLDERLGGDSDVLLVKGQIQTLQNDLKALQRQLADSELLTSTVHRLSSQVARIEERLG